MNTKIIGRLGENQAREFVKKELGFKILACNYSTDVGEIDIIAKDKDIIVFIEVKKRESLKFGRPAEAVNLHKQNKIRRVAEGFLQENNLFESFVRFDVLEILDNEINYISNAF